MILRLCTVKTDRSPFRHKLHTCDPLFSYGIMLWKVFSVDISRTNNSLMNQKKRPGCLDP